ncbi:MAG: hypothetical protein M3Y27_26770 [Acidobacteriota bacterium]|nr:hypothetical protein [Acidobacteriota bacterium]MDQ2949499.1 hypothetical protein [Acidobacteriota bacterium]
MSASDGWTCRSRHLLASIFRRPRIWRIDPSASADVQLGAIYYQMLSTDNRRPNFLAIGAKAFELTQSSVAAYTLQDTVCMMEVETYLRSQQVEVV